MCFDKMNLITNAYVVAIVDVVGPNVEKNMFGLKASSEEPFWALTTEKLSLFKKLYRFLHRYTCKSTSFVAHAHESKFPNLVFFVKQILGFLGSQIKIGTITQHVGYNIYGLLQFVKNAL